MSAAPAPDYRYRAKVIAVHDGDTCTLEIDLGFYVRFLATVRVAGINAPELATPAGPPARDFAAAWLAAAGPGDWPLVIASQKALATIGTEKYGRWLATIWRQADGTELGAALIAAGQAVFWDGHGPRPVPTPKGGAS